MSVYTISGKSFFKKIYSSAVRLRCPQSVMFELTYRCNFDCPHCYVKGSAIEGAELSTKQIFRILDQMKDIGVYSVVFTGGEALLRHDILRFCLMQREWGFS
jgi:MoaA/NifB/PqqE/SkfB family radical SAM enzyme